GEVGTHRGLFVTFRRNVGVRGSTSGALIFLTHGINMWRCPRFTTCAISTGCAKCQDTHEPQVMLTIPSWSRCQDTHAPQVTLTIPSWSNSMRPKFYGQHYPDAKPNNAHHLPLRLRR
ncbi:unnamed protein product, partial [Ectocarpus sp. 12 AP-2014]